MRYNFIHAEKTQHTIHLLCKAFAVSPSGCYAWRNRRMSQRQRDDLILLVHIRAIHKDSFMAYGRERMTEELRELGFVVSERRVARLMKDNNIRVIRTHKFKCTTDSNHNHNVAPNLLERDFWATGPNQKWAGDITYSAPRPGLNRGAYVWNAKRKEVSGMSYPLL